MVVVSDKVIAVRRTVIVARRKMWMFGARFDDVIAIARTGIYKLLRSMGLRVEGLRVLHFLSQQWDGTETDVDGACILAVTCCFCSMYLNVEKARFRL